MARNKNSVQFTSSYQLLCNEVVEETTAPAFPNFDGSNMNVKCVSLIESADATSVAYNTSSGNMTCVELIEDLETSGEAAGYDYIYSFQPTITYSPSVGFTITNFSELLEATQTDANDWIIGLMFVHARRERHGCRPNHHRRIRTRWGSCALYENKYGGASETSTISGLISNTGLVSGSANILQYTFRKL